MTVWLVLLAGGVGSFALRGAMVALWGRWTPPGWFDQATRYVAPAMLGGLVAATLTPQRAPAPSDAMALLAVAVGFVVARRTGSFGGTVLAGLAVWWVLQLGPWA